MSEWLMNSSGEGYFKFPSHHSFPLLKVWRRRCWRFHTACLCSAHAPIWHANICVHIHYAICSFFMPSFKAPHYINTGGSFSQPVLACNANSGLIEFLWLHNAILSCSKISPCHFRCIGMNPFIWTDSFKMQTLWWQFIWIQGRVCNGDRRRRRRWRRKGKENIYFSVKTFELTTSGSAFPLMA